MKQVKKQIEKIGYKAVPNSKKTFPDKKKATIVDDSISFHGALLKVEVSNQYKSKFSGFKNGITIAADRIVTLKERNVKCHIDRHLINIETGKKPKKGSKPHYGGFPWEISRKHLKNFPVIFHFDDKHRFHGLTIIDFERTKRSKRKR